MLTIFTQLEIRIINKFILIKKKGLKKISEMFFNNRILALIILAIFEFLLCSLSVNISDSFFSISSLLLFVTIIALVVEILLFIIVFLVYGLGRDKTKRIVEFIRATKGCTIKDIIHEVGLSKRKVIILLNILIYSKMLRNDYYLQKKGKKLNSKKNPIKIFHEEDTRISVDNNTAKIKEKDVSCDCNKEPDKDICINSIVSEIPIIHQRQGVLSSYANQQINIKLNKGIKPCPSGVNGVKIERYRMPFSLEEMVGELNRLGYSIHISELDGFYSLSERKEYYKNGNVKARIARIVAIGYPYNETVRKKQEYLYEGAKAIAIKYIKLRIINDIYKDFVSSGYLEQFQPKPAGSYKTKDEILKKYYKSSKSIEFAYKRYKRFDTATALKAKDINKVSLISKMLRKQVEKYNKQLGKKYDKFLKGSVDKKLLLLNPLSKVDIDNSKELEKTYNEGLQDVRILRHNELADEYISKIEEGCAKGDKGSIDSYFNYMIAGNKWEIDEYINEVFSFFQFSTSFLSKGILKIKVDNINPNYAPKYNGFTVVKKHLHGNPKAFPVKNIKEFENTVIDMYMKVLILMHIELDVLKTIRVISIKLGEDDYTYNVPEKELKDI